MVSPPTNIRGPEGAKGRRRQRGALGLALLMLSGCSLPQNDETALDAVGAADGASVSPTEIRTWRMLKIIDRWDGDEPAMPGLDVDAIVVFQGDEFVSAGCKGDAVLHGAQVPDAAADQAHTDPTKATLHAVDGEGAAGGFVSLAQGVLTCELPVPIETGAVIFVSDVSSDGGEIWQARLAEDASGDFEDASAELVGSADFVAP